MWLQLQVEDERIVDVRFRAIGCGPTTAAASVGTELLRGRSLKEARELRACAIDEALGGLPADKHHAIRMFFECLRKALYSLKASAQDG